VNIYSRKSGKRVRPRDCDPIRKRAFLPPPERERRGKERGRCSGEPDSIARLKKEKKKIFLCEASSLERQRRGKKRLNFFSEARAGKVSSSFTSKEEGGRKKSSPLELRIWGRRVFTSSPSLGKTLIILFT